MLEINILNRVFGVERKDANYSINGEIKAADIVSLGNNRYQLLLNEVSHVIEVVEFKTEEKQLTIRINNKLLTLTIKDEMDQLLHRLGFDTTATKKINDIKAPMPGMVLRIIAEVGQVISQGDPILVLESMKMENVLKAAGDGVIKAIHAQSGKPVEKGELLISFE